MFGGDGDDFEFIGPPQQLRSVCRQRTNGAPQGVDLFVASHRAVVCLLPSLPNLHAHRTTGLGGDDIMYGGDGDDFYFDGPPLSRSGVCRQHTHRRTAWR